MNFDFLMLDVLGAIPLGMDQSLLVVESYIQYLVCNYSHKLLHAGLPKNVLKVLAKSFSRPIFYQRS
jgi:hypothetical protein